MYGLSRSDFMHRPWDANSAPVSSIWREIYRMLEPGSTFLIFSGTGDSPRDERQDEAIGDGQEGGDVA